MGHREDLLAAARRCMETKGYAHTTARDLVAESNTNLASIGYHFGSKEALLQLALQQAQFEYLGRVLEATAPLAASGQSHERVRSTWEAAIEGFDDNRPVVTAFYEALVQSQHNDELRTTLAATLREVRSGIAQVIEDTGATDSEEEARALASFLIGAFDGVGVQMMIDPDSVPSAAELFDGAAKFFAQLAERATDG